MNRPERHQDEFLGIPVAERVTIGRSNAWLVPGVLLGSIALAVLLGVVALVVALAGATRSAPAPVPAPATRLSITTLPPANVEIDGVLVGRSPLSTTLSPGRHHLRFSGPQLATSEEDLLLRTGEIRAIDRRLVAVPVYQEQPHAAYPPPTPVPSGPNITPSRAEVIDAMHSAQPMLLMCGNGEHGILTAHITFSGRSGRVTSVSVGPSSFTSAVESCAARAIRATSVPPFEQASFTVNYPFRI